MELRVFDDARSAAQGAAAMVATAARDAVAARGQFLVAVSGGRTPALMFRALASEDVPWPLVHVFQVDDRIAPAGHADRNLAELRGAIPTSLLPDEQLHAMPVESVDLTSAVASYAALIERLAGRPAVLDLVHLGLGVDGHTASLVPGDPVMKAADADVALSGVYQGRRRMTLTYPILDRARRVLWLVTGAEKAEMLRRLRDGDRSIPAGRVQAALAVIVADRAAAIGLG